MPKRAASMRSSGRRVESISARSGPRRHEANKSRDLQASLRIRGYLKADRKVWYHCTSYPRADRPSAGRAAEGPRRHAPRHATFRPCGNRRVACHGPVCAPRSMNRCTSSPVGKLRSRTVPRHDANCGIECTGHKFANGCVPRAPAADSPLEQLITMNREPPATGLPIIDPARPGPAAGGSANRASVHGGCVPS
jgi:hypothetical protein